MSISKSNCSNCSQNCSSQMNFANINYDNCIICPHISLHQKCANLEKLSCKQCKKQFEKKDLLKSIEDNKKVNFSLSKSKILYDQCLQYSINSENVGESVSKNFQKKFTEFGKVNFQNKGVKEGGKKRILKDQQYIVVYHGTSLKNAKNIFKYGFALPSYETNALFQRSQESQENQTTRKFGNGIYFTSDIDKAIKFSERDQSIKVVIAAKLLLGFPKLEDIQKPVVYSRKKMQINKFDTIYVSKTLVSQSRYEVREGQNEDQYVVFDSSQVCPLYFIELQKMKQQRKQQILLGKNIEDMKRSQKWSLIQHAFYKKNNKIPNQYFQKTRSIIKEESASQRPKFINQKIINNFVQVINQDCSEIKKTKIEKDDEYQLNLINTVSVMIQESPELQIKLWQSLKKNPIKFFQLSLKGKETSKQSLHCLINLTSDSKKNYKLIQEIFQYLPSFHNLFHYYLGNNQFENIVLLMEFFSNIYIPQKSIKEQEKKMTQENIFKYTENIDQYMKRYVYSHREKDGQRVKKISKQIKQRLQKKNPKKRQSFIYKIDSRNSFIKNK